jgi:hypothetical protein
MPRRRSGADALLTTVGRARLCIGGSYDCRKMQNFLASPRDGSSTHDQFNYA